MALVRVALTPVGCRGPTGRRRPSPQPRQRAPPWPCTRAPGGGGTRRPQWDHDQGTVAGQPQRVQERKEMNGLFDVSIQSTGSLQDSN